MGINATAFTFPPQDDGTGYEVVVVTQPTDPIQTCSVVDGNGTLAGADVINVAVDNAASSPDTIALTVSAQPLAVPTLDRFGLLLLMH